MIEREKIIVVRPEKLERLLNEERFTKDSDIAYPLLPGMVAVVKSICDWDGFQLCRNNEGKFEIMDGEIFLYRWSK